MRRSHGFTLLEVTIALLLTALILLMAIQLLTEVQVTFVEWQRHSTDPIPQLAIQLLRADVQRSRSVTSPPGQGPLALELPDGSSVIYDHYLGELIRLAVNEEGTPEGQRTVLRRVTAWSWHNSLASELVEVSISYERHRDPGSRRLGAIGRVRESGRYNEQLTVRFTQRARPGRRLW